MFRWATLSPLNRVKSLTDRLGEATGPGFVETSPAREISSSAKDAERAKRQPVTASSLFVSDGFDASQELDLLENCKSLECAKYDANCISVKRAVTISPAPEHENCRIRAKFRGNLVKLECFSQILISEIMEKTACN